MTRQILAVTGTRRNPTGRNKIRCPEPPLQQRLTERLQKVLARAGAGSRREVEAWIRQGRVTVDGVAATLGIRVTPGCRVAVDGKVLRQLYAARGASRVLLYHKPVGEICSRDDPSGRPTVFDHLPRLRGRRWVTVGRLDFNTSGLLILSTDGELAHRLMHPSTGIEREYLCRVRGEPGRLGLSRLREGLRLNGQLCRFEQVTARRGQGTNRWYAVVVREGRYREVRRLWSKVGCTVSRLTRIRYGSLRLPRRLRTGQWIELGGPQISELYQLAGLNSSSAGTSAAAVDATYGEGSPAATVGGS